MKTEQGEEGSLGQSQELGICEVLAKGKWISPVPLLSEDGKLLHLW